MLVWRHTPDHPTALHKQRRNSKCPCLCGLALQSVQGRENSSRVRDAMLTNKEKEGPAFLQISARTSTASVVWYNQAVTGTSPVGTATCYQVLTKYKQYNDQNCVAKDGGKNKQTLFPLERNKQNKLKTHDGRIPHPTPLQAKRRETRYGLEDANNHQLSLGHDPHRIQNIIHTCA